MHVRFMFVSESIVLGTLEFLQRAYLALVVSGAFFTGSLNRSQVSTFDDAKGVILAGRGWAFLSSLRGFFKGVG